MGSESKEVRVAQQARIIAACEARKARLAERGTQGRDAARDPKLRKLEADVRRAKRRIAAMEAADAHVKSVIEKGDAVKVKPEKTARKKGGGKAAAPAEGKQPKAPKPKKK
jgi:hypothetical protein